MPEKIPQTPEQFALPLTPDLNLNSVERIKLAAIVRDKRRRGEKLTPTEEAFWKSQQEEGDDDQYRFN